MCVIVIGKLITCFLLLWTELERMKTLFHFPLLSYVVFEDLGPLGEGSVGRRMLDRQYKERRRLETWHIPLFIQQISITDMCQALF